MAEARCLAGPFPSHHHGPNNEKCVVVVTQPMDKAPKDPMTILDSNQLQLTLAWRRLGWNCKKRQIARNRNLHRLARWSAHAKCQW